MSILTSEGAVGNRPTLSESLFPLKWRKACSLITLRSNDNVGKTAKTFELIAQNIQSFSAYANPVIGNISVLSRGVFNFAEMTMLPLASIKTMDALWNLRWNVLSEANFKKAFLESSNLITKVWAAINFSLSAGILFSKTFLFRCNLVYFSSAVISSYVYSQDEWVKLMDRRLVSEERFIALIKLVSHLAWINFGALSFIAITFVPALPQSMMVAFATISYVTAAFAFIKEKSREANWLLSSDGLSAFPQKRGSHNRPSPVRPSLNTGSSQNPTALDPIRAERARLEGELVDARKVIANTQKTLVSVRTTNTNLVKVMQNYLKTASASIKEALNTKLQDSIGSNFFDLDSLAPFNTKAFFEHTIAALPRSASISARAENVRLNNELGRSNTELAHLTQELVEANNTNSALTEVIQRHLNSLEIEGRELLHVQLLKVAGVDFSLTDEADSSAEETAAIPAVVRRDAIAVARGEAGTADGPGSPRASTAIARRRLSAITMRTTATGEPANTGTGEPSHLAGRSRSAVEESSVDEDDSN